MLYLGRLCQTNFDDCASAPCKNGGKCVDRVNGFICNCTEDYMGVTCEKPYEACELRPCKNNGTCFPTANRKNFTCSCLPGN